MSYKKFGVYRCGSADAYERVLDALEKENEELKAQKEWLQDENIDVHQQYASLRESLKEAVEALTKITICSSRDAASYDAASAIDKIKAKHGGSL